MLKLLIDRDMKKTDLLKAKILVPSTLAKIEKGEKLSLLVIEKLCKFLECQPKDLIEYISENEHIIVDIN